MIFLTDGKRHLISYPYSKDNCHEMAKILGIKKCWWHKDHYDIPKKRIEEIQNNCLLISSKELYLIIKGRICLIGLNGMEKENFRQAN
jgi:hypothetical protein